MLAHGSHGLFRTDGKQYHADHQQNAAIEEDHDNMGRHGYNGNRKYKDNRYHRQDCLNHFTDFFLKDIFYQDGAVLS